uniref:conjugal transfer protein TraI n=1 Tax=Pedobacter schmidteae TaxID=2201271 RepID=UPI000EAE0589|nr:conjugal transfer protein TraI [Pedobacter schmidteae]
MKKYVLIFFLSIGLAAMPTMESKAIVWKVITAAIKKVLQAIDLQIQRQQNKVIWLQNAQKTLENALSKLKLKEIGEWTEKQRKIYKEYFDELHKVKTLISYYQRIKDITKKQAQLVSEYKRAWAMIRSDKHFTFDEIAEMGRVYEGILEETVKNIDQLSLVVNSFITTMSDAKRLEIIASVDNKVDENLDDLRRFNSENAILSLKRAQSQHEIDVVKKMYGLTDPVYEY